MKTRIQNIWKALKRSLIMRQRIEMTEKKSKEREYLLVFVLC